MWGQDQASFVPDSLEDEEGWQVVYGDEGAAGHHHERVPSGRGGRPGAAAGSTAPPQQRQGQRLASPATSPGGAAELRRNSPGAVSPADGQQGPPLTLAQELQTVLHGLTQQPGMAQQQRAGEQQQQQQQQQSVGWGTAAPLPQQLQQEQQGGPGSGRQRRSGSRQIMHPSPAVPLDTSLPGEAGGGAASRPGSGGRRWHQARAAAAAAAQQWSPAVPAAGTSTAGGGDTFFEVDADLLQVAQRQQAQAQQAALAHARQQRRQQRTQQWDSPQAPAPSQLAPSVAAVAEHTPLPSQRTNPLAALLGSGGGGAGSVQRPATTGGKLQCRHPIYGQAVAAAPSSVGGGTATSSSRIREQLGLRDAPARSPRQQQQRRQPQPQHSRFAIKDLTQAAPGAADGVAAPAAAGLRLLTGSEPASVLRQQPFQPRPMHPAGPGEWIEEEGAEEEAGEQDAAVACRQRQPQQQQQHEAAADGAAAADAFRTPGPPLRRARQDELPLHTGCGIAAAAPATGDGGAPGSSGGRGTMSLQRQFIAQLQPVSRPAAAATMQQQRQRLAGAAGLHARMQSMLAADKARAQMQSPAGGGVAAGPRLSILEKELEGNITKCLCSCDSAAAAALGTPQVVALLQNRTAREVDTAPGCALLLREPWTVLSVPGSPWPAVLCFSAVGG